MANSMAGQESVQSVTGPIAHSVPGEDLPLILLCKRWQLILINCLLDLRLFLTAVLAQEPWKYDSKVIPLPWRQSEEDVIKNKIKSGGLTLGFYNCDGMVSYYLCRRII